MPPDKDFVSAAGTVTPLRDTMASPAEMVSIVIPVYNETANLRALWTRLEPVVEALGRTYEVIFVDDGSRDDSLDILREFAAHNPRVRVVELARNFGQHSALLARFGRSVCCRTCGFSRL